MDKIDYKAVMESVLKEHKVVLDQDDPIMVTVTINRLILQRYIAEVEEILEKNNEIQSKELKFNLDQAKKTAEEIITKATDYASQQARQQFEEFQKELQSQSGPGNQKQANAPPHPNNRIVLLLVGSVGMVIGALFMIIAS